MKQTLNINDFHFYGEKTPHTAVIKPINPKLSETGNIYYNCRFNTVDKPTCICMRVEGYWGYTSDEGDDVRVKWIDNVVDG
jgi:hypothetical protein